ncbi:MAG: YitT family protein [Oscillospiraceae bacterium]|jgi:uncharacterized membrane-anchored protein YitT (DUF2179 family)|nr:YitT family protein [Oscillospiraceae bacterium]
MKKRHADYAVIVFCAMLMALSYHIFIFPNRFAPSGILGIATMLQYLFNFRAGYLSIIVNIPLVIVVYFLIGHKFAIRSAVFACLFSATMIALDYVDLSRFVYYTETGTSTVLAPIAGGVISGFCYGAVMKRSSSTGGTDLVAAWVHKYHPEQNLIWMIFSLNVVVAAASYFVYDYMLEPVILCLINCFITSQVGDMMLKGFKEAVKFEIVTDQPAELTKDLLENLHHGVTKLSAVGAFTEKNKTLLICVVNKHQIVKFEKIIQKYPGSFAYLTTVKGTIGAFEKMR